MSWIGGRPQGDPWRGIRVLCFLHHTSLFEWLFIAMAPPRFLWRVACHGVVPAAEKTTSRPIVGQFFKLVGAHVVSISRERDHTWREVLSRIDPGLDGRHPAGGQDEAPQRSGLEGPADDGARRHRRHPRGHPEGPMLVAYSGGLHHVQAPGERLPRPFRKIRMNFELLEIATYRAGSAAGSRRADRIQDAPWSRTSNGAATGTARPEPAARQACRPPQAREFHSRSGSPLSRFAARARTKSRSESRLR